MLILFWDHTRLYVDKTPDLLDFLELTNAQWLVVVFVILGCLRVNFLIKKSTYLCGDHKFVPWEFPLWHSGNESD